MEHQTSDDTYPPIFSLPEEIIAKILNYLTDPISSSQVCTFFKLIATSHIRKIHIKLSSEKSDEIKFKQLALEDFTGLREVKLELVYDVNNVEKSAFFQRFHDKLTHLVLREMTFLNPFFEHLNTSLCNLETLIIQNSDLTSCSTQVAHYIVRCCPKLKNLIIEGCSGLEIDALNYIGVNLNQTRIETFQLLPTYSYFDVGQSPSTTNNWTIDNLRILSIKSKLVVMKKNFVKNLLARRNVNLKSLDLIAELDLGEPLAAKIIQNYPNLEQLCLGKGCAIIKNEDFTTLSNFYRKLKTFEFHFSQSETPLDLRGLLKNESVQSLTIGLTKNISLENLQSIAKCLPSVTRLNIVLYSISNVTSNQEFLTQVTKMFPNIQQLSFQRTGMSKNMSFSAIKDDFAVQAPNPFDEIKNLKT